MINKKPTRKYAMLKNFFILPAAAFIIYAFSTPEYHYASPPVSNPLTIYQTQGIQQKEVKGIVVKEDGKPIEGVNITSTGTMGNAFMATSGKDGRFSIANVQADAALLFSCRGYKGLSIKPDFSKEMNVKMELNPDDKLPAGTNPNAPQAQRKEPTVVIDGVISEKNMAAATKYLGYNNGLSKFLYGKEATDKYGDKGANGVYEITTRERALAMGLKPPFPRLAPQDYPTFQNMKFSVFSEWVAAHAKYPAEAQEKKLGGWVSVNFKVELDGTLTNVVSSSGKVDPLLVNEILKVIQSSPKWEGPVNKDVDEPFSTSVTLQFKLPDQILNNAPFVVVQEMPMYPGGDVELLNFIKNNTKYPEQAKANKIQGRVILRFVVTTNGNADGISVLKGVDPSLDAEAIRVVSLLKGFKPGKQGGEPVNVWYMVPVTFKLDMQQADFNKTSLLDILNFLGRTTGYPQEAKNAQDTGKVFVVLKLGKGGIIKECKAVTDKSTINVPFLPEVVIVGFNKTPGQNEPKTVKVAGDEHPLLKAECERVARLLTVNEIPDWNDKDLEFALNFRFVLK